MTRYQINIYKTIYFIAQALRDLDFEVREKLFLESVFDIEFQDPTISDKAVFYTGITIMWSAERQK